MGSYLIKINKRFRKLRNIVIYRMKFAVLDEIRTCMIENQETGSKNLEKFKMDGMKLGHN